MAQQLDIPRGTVSSRAYALQQQSKISARSKGGTYPRQTPPNTKAFPSTSAEISADLRHWTNAAACPSYCG